MMQKSSNSIPVKEGLSPLFQVFDMPTSVRFYRDILGFSVVNHSPERGPDDFDWCMLRNNDAVLMLNTRFEHDSRPPARDPAQVAAHDDTCLYIGCPDVDAAYAYLQSKGVESRPPKIAPYGFKQVYLHDPDGYNLCLQWTA
jgi:catechol 2,3-dioxygenase-like lactoylglutathione lyase family enzyme